MGQMSEIGALRANTPRSGEGFIEAHVGRMRLISQGIKHDDIDASYGLNDIRRHFLTIAEIGKLLAVTLGKQEPGARDLAVGQYERRYLQITDFKRTVDHALFRDEIAPWPWPFVKSECKNAPQVRHCFFGGVNGHRFAAA